MPTLLCPASAASPVEHVPAPSRFHSTTIVSIAATFDTEGSFLLLRRRSGHLADGHVLTLSGDFGISVNARLVRALAGFPADGKPLTLDLRNVTHLDESCFNSLLQTRPGPAGMSSAENLLRCDISPVLPI